MIVPEREQEGGTEGLQVDLPLEEDAGGPLVYTEIRYGLYITVCYILPLDIHMYVRQ